MSLSRALLYDWDIEPYMYMNMPPNPDSCHRLKKKKKKKTEKGGEIMCARNYFLYYTVCACQEPEANPQHPPRIEDLRDLRSLPPWWTYFNPGNSNKSQ